LDNPDNHIPEAKQLHQPQMTPQNTKIESAARPAILSSTPAENALTVPAARLAKGIALGVCACLSWMSAVSDAEESGPPPAATKARNVAKEIEVTVTPADPYLLPDGSTRIMVLPETIWLGRNGRTGTVQVKVGDSVLDVVPRTVIVTGGYRYVFNTAPKFQFREVHDDDMIITQVDECTLSVLSSKQDGPPLALKELKDTVELECSHNMPCLEVHTIRGDGKHFVSFKPTMVEVARFAPSNVLGAKLRMNVINNFGAKSINLEYMKRTQVTIGKETITLESSGFDYETKRMKIMIQSVPTTSSATATIVEYGSQP
jgi:hypothetical protein